MPQHVRHKPPTRLDRPRELILACPPFRSRVNLSRLVRLAGCAGMETMVVCGNLKVDPKIARDAVDSVAIIRRRTLVHALRQLREQGYRLVGLEQTDGSQLIYQFAFPRKTALVIGHERHGLTSDELAEVDDLIEIPVHGRPASYNVVTATTMAVYEYCRQYPTG